MKNFLVVADTSCFSCIEVQLWFVNYAAKACTAPSAHHDNR